MELQKLCAYNQTRECFLGLEVAAADLSYAALQDVLGKLPFKSGEGLWMTPFRGIPEKNMRVPLDLVYLDEEFRVIEVVESFPTFRVSPSSPPAASVLALPTHSIYSSQTQPGDQLVLCVAEEMQRRLERFTGVGEAALDRANCKALFCCGASRYGAAVRVLWRWRSLRGGSFAGRSVL